MVHAGRSRVCLIHWNRIEAERKAEHLIAEGFHPEICLPEGLSFLKTLKDDPPEAIVISLDRLPTQGRDVALAIRLNKETRRIPILFAGGEAAKIARVKESLPDAAYAGWSAIGKALRRAMSSPPAPPTVPASVLAGYAKSPLDRKLNLRPDSVVALIDAPDGFAELLLSLAPDVQLQDRPKPNCNILFWFVRSAFELDANIDLMAAFVKKGSMWILWPKRTSGVDSGLSPERLRTAAMASGLVDYKICSVDKTWSGLLFSRRKV